MPLVFRRLLSKPRLSTLARTHTLVPGLALIVSAMALAPASAADEGALTTWVPTGTFASSSFERVSRDPGADVDDAPRRLELAAVRNAPVSAQLAVTAHQDLAGLSVELVNGRPPQGTRPLPHSAVTIRYPDFVPVDGTADVIADPLRADPPDVAAEASQPIWFTIEIPASLQAGSYGVQLRVEADGVDAVLHELVVDVADVTLEDPSDYDFYLNLWMQPDAVAYAHEVEVHSEQHWRLLDAYLEDMASRGQKVINASIIEDPWEIGWPDGSWRAQTYYPFHTLVDWRHDGETWEFDYDAFDRYVKASKRAGIGPDIRVYALLMFGGRERLYYEDTRTGEMVREVVQLGDARWREAWSAFLTDFEQHLRSRGWFDDTMLAFDERPSATMRVVQDFLAEEAPAFADKVHIAVHTMDVDHTISDISYAHGLLPQVSGELLEERRGQGYLTTFYTTGAPWTPNTLTTSPPVGARLLGWIPQQYGLDGYLRWSYNSWPSDDPFNDPAYRYAQGDEYIVYPGDDSPVSSIRWETFRDGVVDHELLTQLAVRGGENNSAYREALTMVDANANPSPQLYEDVLAARALVVSELEELRGLEVGAEAEPSTAVAGEEAEVVVTLGNDAQQPVTQVSVDVVGDEAWLVERLEGGSASHVLPGETFTSRFAVSVPEAAASGRETVTARIGLRRVGQPVTLEQLVPIDVQAAAGVNGFSAEPVELLAGQSTTLTADLVNRRAQATSTTLSISAPSGWEIEPAAIDLELAAGAEESVSFTAQPSDIALSGRQEFGAELTLSDQIVEDASTEVFYNEVAASGVTIHSVSSEELVGEDGAAANLLDGDPLTLWHSQWFDRVAEHPHEVVLDLGAERTIHALNYLPRQTGTMNGTVKDYEVYVSPTPDSWDQPVATGAFVNVRDEQRVDFPATHGRYVRFVALSEQSGQPFASGAGLTVMVERQGPYPSLAAAQDIVAFTDDDLVNPPNLGGGVDGDGSSYSWQALEDAGVLPGGTFSHNGFEFTWPDKEGYQAVLADRQLITVDASASAVGFITAGEWGPVSGTGVVNYTDGSTTEFTISDPDWQTPDLPADADVALVMPYHNHAHGGRIDRDTYLFFHEVSTDPAKTIETVALPNSDQGGRFNIAVFSMSLR